MKLNRKEIVEQLKEYGLLEQVKIMFGDNYTRVSTENLDCVIQWYNKKHNPEKKELKRVEQVEPENINDLGLRKAFVKLLTTLQMSETLFPDEISSILEEL